MDSNGNPKTISAKMDETNRVVNSNYSTVTMCPLAQDEIDNCDNDDDEAATEEDKGDDDDKSKNTRNDNDYRSRKTKRNVSLMQISLRSSQRKQCQSKTETTRLEKKNGDDGGSGCGGQEELSLLLPSRRQRTSSSCRSSKETEMCSTKTNLFPPPPPSSKGQPDLIFWSFPTRLYATLEKEFFRGRSNRTLDKSKTFNPSFSRKFSLPFLSFSKKTNSSSSKTSSSSSTSSLEKSCEENCHPKMMETHELVTRENVKVNSKRVVFAEPSINMNFERDLELNKDEFDSNSPFLLKSLSSGGGIIEAVDEILGPLYIPYKKQVRCELVRQSRDLLVCYFQGNVSIFRRHFLLPAAKILSDFRNKETNSSVGYDHIQVPLSNEKKKKPTGICEKCIGWPLCLKDGQIVLRLGELEPSCVKPGDYYFCVRPKKKKPDEEEIGAELVFRYSLASLSFVKKDRNDDDEEDQRILLEHVIGEVEFGKVFGMEGRVVPSLLGDAPVVSDEQMTSMLQHMLVSVEKGIHRIRWELQQTSLDFTRPPPPPSITLTTVADTSSESSSLSTSNSSSSSSATDTLCSQSSSCCCCGNLHTVNLKDFGVQTSPIEEHKEGPSLPLTASKESDVEDSDTTVILKTEVPCTSNVTSQKKSNSGTEVEVLVDADDEGASERKTSKGVVEVKVRDSSHWDEGATNTTTTTIIAAATNTTSTNNNGNDNGNGKEETDDGYHDNSITTPTFIFEVNEQGLKSNVAFIPGCRDRTGRVVVTINLGILQNNNHIGAVKLAQILLYYHAVPRKELAGRGFLILVDARNSAKESLSLLDEAFCLLEGNINGAVNTVVVWRNLPSNHSSTDTSPRKNLTSLFPRSGVKFEVVHLIEEVQKVIKPDQLLVSLGGEYEYDHLKWIEFRKSLEPFMQSCRAVGRRLISVMQEMKGNSLPSTSVLATQTIEQHKTFVGQVFGDPQLVLLQQTGPDTLRELEETRRLVSHNHDFRDSVERCSALYSELQRAIIRLVRLADKKLQKLEQYLQMRTFEEETTQVLTWLSKKGEETLNKHQVVANSLGGIKAQERDFEKFYFLAMRHIEKGNDLLEEASSLSQKDNADTNGIKDLAKSLKQQLSNFSMRLEDQREKLEDTSKCYQLLDKAYEWALEAMKFISRLKMEQYTSPEQLSCLIKHLRHYLETHPPLSEEMFTEMIELATKLINDRLLEQCKVAQVRCCETADLIRTRQQTLIKAKEQLESECMLQRHRQQEQILDQVSEAMATRSPKTYQPTATLWMPYATSTPCYPYARRRSVSGLPYNIVTPPFSYFGVGVAPSHRLQDSKLLISEEQDENLNSVDCSPRTDSLSTDEEVVTVSQLQGCIEEAKENEASSVAASEDSTSTGSDSSTDKTSRDVDVSSSGETVISASMRQVSTKQMKRSQTWQFEDEVWDVVPLRPTYGIGQLTKNTPTRGSAESIPSITENEDSGLSSKLGAGFPPVPVNTHLHQRGSSLNLQFQATSMADLRPSDDCLKHRKTVLLIMREMIQTERDYVKSLEYIIENYIPELLREDIPQALRGKRNVIFGNIEKIYEFHSRYFLKELEQCEMSPSQVGPCFLRYESHFYLYALYNKNKPKSDCLLAEYGSLFFKSKQMELGDKMDLASYLLKPVQRMGKYSLLLKQLLKEVSEKDPEYAGLIAAKDMVNFQLRHGNDLLAMDALRECDMNLKEQGCLLRQDEFLVFQGKSRKCLRQVFLFEELIVFSKARGDPTKKGHDIYQYKSSLKMADIGLTEQMGESNTKFEIWFRKRKLHDTHILQAPNPEIRQSWIQEISKLLWKQALRNREMRLAEMSSMGIGNKPCLDIKPSSDQISDRSISISQLNKAPRFRNSIAVTSAVYLRNNKRPHSIISVSSSSSGSSQSSTGPFYGALNLGFDPNDSPKSRHRSVTQHSQCSSESGIVPDISLHYDSLYSDCENHKMVQRSNSNTSNDSIGTCSLPVSPEETLEEDAGIGADGP